MTKLEEAMEEFWEKYGVLGFGLGDYIAEETVKEWLETKKKKMMQDLSALSKEAVEEAIREIEISHPHDE